MEKSKNKNVIVKIIFTIIIATVLMIMAGSSVKAETWDFTMGKMDLFGGEGICVRPHTYLFGDYFCINHGNQLVRSIGGMRVVYLNRINGNYYNEEIRYSNVDNPKTEQSIAAARYVYEQGQATAPQFQGVVWASGQWAGKKGYVNNLMQYKNDNLYGNASNKAAARGSDWANFYYNLLQESGNNKVNIDVKPKSESDIRVCVNQPDRTFIQGPYEINIVDSSGNVMNNKATQWSTEYSDIGTLVYREIVGQNTGEDIFQFCKITSATVTIRYTDGSTSTKTIDTASTSGSVKILDESGTTIPFPEFGSTFYLGVPMGSESRTVENLEMDFKLEYTTEMKGITHKYKSTSIEYEISNDKLKSWANSTLEYTHGNESGWKLEESINTVGTQNNDSLTLKVYLVSKISSNASKEIKVLGVRQSENFNCALNYYDEGWGSMMASGNMLQAVKDRLQTNYQNCVTTETKDFGYDEGVDTDGDGIDDDTVHHYDWKSRYVFSGRNDSGSYTSGWDYSDAGFALAAGLEYAESKSESWYNKIIDDKGKCYWHYSWHGQNPVMTEDTSVTDIIQPVAIVELTGSTYEEICNFDETNFHLIGTDCTTEIGGKVWEDIKQTKDSIINGMLDQGDKMYAGMLVELHQGDRNGPIIATTTTDKNGKYHFYKLNALEKYTVVFTFNGQMYQQSYYKNDISGDGGYSNAKEVDREGFNDRFDKIDSSPNNYNLNGWHTSYGKDVKLRDASGNYIPNGTDKDGNTLALKYIDAWNKFVEFATNPNTFDKKTNLYTAEHTYTSAYNSLYNWLNERGVGPEERDNVIQYMKDCMISAETIKYPVYDYFVIEDINNPKGQANTQRHAGRTWDTLYTARSDQSRNVDFSIDERDTADLALQKDVYKATVRVNGKTHTYMYNKKDENVDKDGNWNLPIRQSDNLYNGDYRYNREIRKSEYLYDGSVSAAENQNASAKDLQVFVTYRIVIRNQSQTYATVVNEIVDYFDETEYQFDGALNGNDYAPHVYKEYDSNGNVTREYINSYVGDRNGNKVKDLTITNTTTLGNGVGDTNLGHNYKPIYLSGITKTDGSDRLSTGEMAFVYLTFKVKTHTDENNMPDRVQMDVNTQTGEAKGVGKRNLAEINGYSTYYKQGIKVPDTLNSDNTKNDKDVSMQKGGSVDIDSSAGNLSSQDLRENGDIILEKDPNNPNRENPVTTRGEDDSDKAPNIRLVFPENDNQERVITGYVYEDERNTASDKAVVGNGKYDDGETKINGVTLQLVELVQAVDEDGIPTGSYLGEYVWNAKTWDGNKWIDSNSSNTSGSIRYYSGQKETLSPIICGPGATKIEGYTITEDGKYAFKSVPAGDLFIRFIYGDTTQTTLTKVDGEGKDVIEILNGNAIDNKEGYISNEGLNAKSYNGQDYKSTAYQRNLTDGTEVNQSAGTFNGINGYLDYDKQNYSILGQGQYGPSTVNPIDGRDKEVMYYYNIGESSVYSGISDAKDVNNIRENVNNYSRGIENIDAVQHQTLTNRRGEVLTSGLKVSSGSVIRNEDGTDTYNPSEQVAMLKELMNNTAMVAQTGVIDAEVEYNTTQTNNQGDKNVIGYVIDDVDLGLEERPVSQLKLNKEVTNFKLTLSNGAVMFDTGKSVTNLSYAKHTGHGELHYTYGNALRLAQVILSNNSAAVPELITTYMDEELMYGARLELTYAFTVTNIGDVDYLDKQFYYIGRTNNTNTSNISKTRADKVIDYISNNLQFVPTNENNGAWSIRTVQDLTDRKNTLDTGLSDNSNDRQDLVNTKYKDTMETYNNIVTTGQMSDELLPELAKAGGTSASTQMLLSTTLVPDTGDDSMVYNNLVEIVQSSNTQGRRMKYSVPGNQQMANQDLTVGTPVIEDKYYQQYTKADLVTPQEVDTDSSQKVLILPPTGSNKNYNLWILLGAAILVLIGGSVIFIKKFLNKNK